MSIDTNLESMEASSLASGSGYKMKRPRISNPNVVYAWSGTHRHCLAASAARGFVHNVMRGSRPGTVRFAGKSAEVVPLSVTVLVPMSSGVLPNLPPFPTLLSGSALKDVFVVDVKHLIPNTSTLASIRTPASMIE